MNGMLKIQLGTVGRGKFNEMVNNTYIIYACQNQRHYSYRGDKF